MALTYRQNAGSVELEGGTSVVRSNGGKFPGHKAILLI